MDNKPFISVSIKTLNESECIEKTIDSIRKQLIDYPHKIIVADSLSTDNTQQLAIDKGVTVVSLTDPGDRCCGVGHQLGYLYSEGEYRRIVKQCVREYILIHISCIHTLLHLELILVREVE